MSTSKIIEISKKLGLSHIGSCLTTFPILEEIYSIKRKKDLVILDNAHAHLAHLMFTHPNDAQEVRQKYGTHCDTRAGCVVNGGSLGHALGIGIGLALTDLNRDIYIVISDGSSCEGSIGESLRIAHDLKLTNLKIYANFNGHSALAELDLDYYEGFIRGYKFPVKIFRTKCDPQYSGVNGHYCKAL